MTRLRRTLQGVFSSYILLAATTIYSLASIPVALHYLDTSHFGLWVLMGTLVGYLNLLDMGMTGAASRLLIDHKDDRDGGGYGGLLKTGMLVCMIQGGMIFLIGLEVSGKFSQILTIPEDIQGSFIQLMQWQCGALALSFSIRVLGMMLGAHQRMDIANYTGALGLLVNFVIQWIYFHLGRGVLSLALGALSATIFTGFVQAVACYVLRLYPCRGSWGRVSWEQFKELFLYGKDLLLVSSGTQMIMASQSIVITRMLGLEAAATWGIGTRVYNLLNQVIWRISDMSAAAFSEMMIRGEYDRLRDRYSHITMLSFSVAAWVAVSFVSCNSLFVTIWTHGKIHWPEGNDLLLGILMILGTAIHCHSGLVLISKKIGFMRYIYFLEGIVFVALSFLVARQGGLPAIILSSIICSVLFSGSYLTWRIGSYFGLSLKTVALEWMLPMAKMLAFYIPSSALIWYCMAAFPDLVRLIATIVASVFIGLYLLLRFGVNEVVKDELSERLPTGAALILRRVLM